MTRPQATRQLRRSRSTNSARPRQLHVEPLEERRMLAGRAAEAINLFALDVYQHLQREQGNLFFSPLSIVTGLTMAYAGAAGQTADEMEQVLRLGEEPGIHEAFAELMDSIASHNESFAFPKLPHVLTVANAVWPDDDLTVEQGFLDVMQGQYDSHVQKVDYNDPQSAEKIINSWVNNETKGKIDELVSDLSPFTRMVLTNAVYFNGYWQTPFDPRYSDEGPFTLPGGQAIVVPTMYTEQFTPYAVLDGYQVLELPFDPGTEGADYSMVFVLPPQAGANELSPELFGQINAWFDQPLRERHVLIKLPKINTAVSTDFKELLVGLGMPTAFSQELADFSAMTPEQVAIWKVFHKTTLTINEQGTTAAAATEIEFGICFAAGTPVMTPEGFKAIDELQEGDLVLARDEHNVEGRLEPKRVEKVHRSEGKILELQVRGQRIRTTDAHPLFVKGRGWTPAGDLRPRDLLSTDAGDWTEVEAVELTSFSQPVYNLRVADYHTYFVGREDWGFAVWVHNACSGEEPEFFADRPFHLLIRDNITSTIAFMGRIDDPRQLQNSVAPLVVAPNADFDGNLTVDGADFLAWQRGFGASSAGRSDGDSNADGVVDASDLAAWMQAFGQEEALPNAAAASSDITSPANLKTNDTLSSAQLLDAAMALDWLAPDGIEEDATLADNRWRIPELAVAKALDDEPLSASAAVAVTVDALTLTTDEGQPTEALQLDDNPLAVDLE